MGGGFFVCLINRKGRQGTLVVPFCIACHIVVTDVFLQ